MKNIAVFWMVAAVIIAGLLITRTVVNPSRSTDNIGGNTSRGKKPSLCISVITPAQNDETGEIVNFPTPCDVPAGWTPIRPTPVKDPGAPPTSPISFELNTECTKDSDCGLWAPEIGTACRVCPPCGTLNALDVNVIAINTGKTFAACPPKPEKTFCVACALGIKNLDKVEFKCLQNQCRKIIK